MASGGKMLEIGPEEFAFHFVGGGGVDANDLGLFLQRAATVARQQGAELIVTATRPGSLAVICKAIASSQIAKGAKAEFLKAPVAQRTRVVIKSLLELAQITPRPWLSYNSYFWPTFRSFYWTDVLPVS